MGNGQILLSYGFSAVGPRPCRDRGTLTLLVAWPYVCAELKRAERFCEACAPVIRLIAGDERLVFGDELPTALRLLNE